MATNTAKFFGRVWITDSDGVIDKQVWVNEIEPMDAETGKRCSAEWVDEALSDTDENDWRDMLELPKQGDFQVVFSGQIDAWQDYEGEWDQSVSIEKIDQAAIPKEWLDSFFSERNEMRQSENRCG